MDNMKNDCKGSCSYTVLKQTPSTEVLECYYCGKIITVNTYHDE